VKRKKWPLRGNPSYSGSRNQEDHGLKPAWTNSWRDPISKKSLSHYRLVNLGPEFKLQHYKKRKRKKK
jgi:hypothetical protein